MTTEKSIINYVGTIEKGATRFQIECVEHGEMVNGGNGHFYCPKSGCETRIHIEVW